MLRRFVLSAASAVVLALAAGGCGSSTSTSTSSSPSSSPMTGTSTRTTAQVLRTSPAPLPAGTPPAPAGLAQTGGFGTYELCRGHCTGAVPASLRRALHLPGSRVAGCPVSSGETPVSVSGGTRVTAQRFVGSRWLAARVTWRASAGYHGPLLIRGRQLGTAGTIGFGEGHRPYDELQLMNSGRGERTASGGARAWLSLTRVRRPGCYAYQVDGTDFSRVIVFRVLG
jgi:hypothetical protein